MGGHPVKQRQVPFLWESQSPAPHYPLCRETWNGHLCSPAHMLRRVPLGNHPVGRGPPAALQAAPHSAQPSIPSSPGLTACGFAPAVPSLGDTCPPTAPSKGPLHLQGPSKCCLISGALSGLSRETGGSPGLGAGAFLTHHVAPVAGCAQHTGHVAPTACVRGAPVSACGWINEMIRAESELASPTLRGGDLAPVGQQGGLDAPGQHWNRTERPASWLCAEWGSSLVGTQGPQRHPPGCAIRPVKHGGNKATMGLGPPPEALGDNQA